MDNAQAELSQPASAVMGHHLSALLATAIRSSNAQYDDAGIINRLVFT